VHASPDSSLASKARLRRRRLGHVAEFRSRVLLLDGVRDIAS
jgi:hypothetical protein